MSVASEAELPSRAPGSRWPEGVRSGEAPRRLTEGARRFLSDLCCYGLVSVVALACDYGLLLLLVGCGLHYLVAATVSFSAGMAVAYALSIRFVFATRRAVSREVEAAGFFAVGIVGLLLTQALLYLFVSRFGLAVALAKIPTTGIVFLFNFLCRRGLVFVRPRSP